MEGRQGCVGYSGCDGERSSGAVSVVRKDRFQYIFKVELGRQIGFGGERENW